MCFQGTLFQAVFQSTLFDSADKLRVYKWSQEKAAHVDFADQSMWARICRVVNNRQS